jgi:hypothetical protein
VASHRLHFFDGFKFTARFVRVKNLSGDDRQTVPCVFMAAVVGTETYLFNKRGLQAEAACMPSLKIDILCMK